MSVRIIMSHDPGCNYARESDGGHSDASKRVSDSYNLHKSVGIRSGWLAFRLSNGESDGTVYPSRSEAVSHQHHNEKWFMYVQLNAPRMSVCEAASMLRFHRMAAEIAPADRDARGGGIEVIPRLSVEDRERQIAAMAGRVNMPIALGRSVTG